MALTMLIRTHIIFSTGFRKKILNVFKTETELFETAVCHPTHIYLLSTTLQIQTIGWNTAQLTFIFAVGQ